MEVLKYNKDGGGCLHENCPIWINPNQKISASELKPNMTIIDGEGNETFIKIVTKKNVLMDQHQCLLYQRIFV